MCKHMFDDMPQAQPGGECFSDHGNLVDEYQGHKTLYELKPKKLISNICSKSSFRSFRSFPREPTDANRTKRKRSNSTLRRLLGEVFLTIPTYRASIYGSNASFCSRSLIGESVCTQVSSSVKSGTPQGLT